MVRVLPIGCETIRGFPKLLEEYAEECSIPVLGKPDPQWETYAGLEASGFFIALGGWAGADLVGFATVLVYVLPHYGKLVATVESLFVAREYRSGGAGSALLAEVKAVAKAKGCAAVFYSAPAGGKLEAVLGKRTARTNSIFCESLA